ncbi:hypothetical protein UFOVP929_17 [uncultured Caudovirales phage]|uniref:Uncharacterized protein n=1 Tax=uncultured Caudovirales phage TaxID=2100421 RepID=A0A6J5PP49_9CAUD|nr:hypothetical protein UFOVP929_17 [uncultured Caudovirales phage]
MTTSDVDRLYDAVEKLRQEVHMYRADLNGRLRRLEVDAAEAAAREELREAERKNFYARAGLLVACGSVATAIITNAMGNM